MMQRRTLIKSATAAATLGLPGLGALAQQAVTLKFHTFMAPTSNVYLNAHKAWMNKVEKDAGGQWTQTDERAVVGYKFAGVRAGAFGGSAEQAMLLASDEAALFLMLRTAMVWLDALPPSPRSVTSCAPVWPIFLRSR